MKLIFVFLLVINCIFSLTAQNIKNEENAKCRMTEAYPPPQERELPWYTINLDLDPKERWKEVTIAFRDGIEALINQVLTDWTSKVVTDVLNAITNNEDEILDRFPNGYGDEIRGISMYGNLSLDVLILYNVMYEVEGLCTSIVAQNTSGHVIHGRNLDFGLFMGFNWTDQQWEVTQELRGILFNAIFYKNNMEVFRGVWYAGYVGLLTGMKHLGFSITVDTRYDNNFDKYLIEWFRNPNDNSQFLSFTTRTVMESISNYDDAVANLTTTPFIGPCYIIIGGYQYNEGAVLTMGPNLTLVDIWPIPKALPMNSTTKWYVLETNYDHWNQPPWFDDRRYPAEACMNEIGENNIALPTLYNVLNGKPNRNRLTTYTALMDVANNHLESYLQYCDDLDCPPW